MHAFVTGATGFLGFAIVEALVRRGASVVALARGDGLPVALGDAVTVARADLCDAEALTRVMRGCDVVFHVAADVRMVEGARADATRTNVAGTAAVVQAAKSAGVRRLVYTSTAASLGKPLDHTRGPVRSVDETSAYNFHAMNWVYPHTKWLGEQEVRRLEGVDWVITHPAAIFGPGDWKGNLLPLFTASRGPLGRFATGGARSVCDVRDVAEAHLAAAERGQPGEAYALGGEAVDVAELLTWIAAETGGRPPSVVLPAGVVRGVGRVFDAFAAVTGRAPLLSAEMAVLSTLRTVVSSEKARTALGYASRPARESVRDLAAWYRVHGRLID